jgi:hypothetical protein
MNSPPNLADQFVSSLSDLTYAREYSFLRMLFWCGQADQQFLDQVSI